MTWNRFVTFNGVYILTRIRHRKLYAIPIPEFSAFNNVISIVTAP